MALVIDDAETEALIQRLSEETGDTASQTVRNAVSERLTFLQDARVQRRRRAIRKAQEAMRALPVLDTRSADEIIGYNEFGMFD